jgi:hypothetical protein
MMKKLTLKLFKGLEIQAVSTLSEALDILAEM